MTCSDDINSSDDW